jgi:DNA repair photolyase
MTSELPPRPTGRGSIIKPKNRFLSTEYVDDFEHFEGDEEFLAELGKCATEYFPDTSKSIVSQNDSPDLAFRYSLNPYRGCAHGCAYCYARPTHEYLGLNAGIDFESKIFVKEEAPKLLREFLCRPGYEPDVIQISGVTDCYQPIERKFRLTRGCLEVALEARQPISIVTKNALIVRDLDLFQEMAKRKLILIFLSVTSLKQELTRVLEPRTSAPEARLKAIEKLSAAGVPVGMMVAPIIPGLNDSEIPAILEAGANAGALRAQYTLLRLPWTVKPVFEAWLTEHVPEQAEKILNGVRSTRGGKLNDANYGSRMRGEGLRAEQVGRTFEVFRRKFGLDRTLPALECGEFRKPNGQRLLF